ncbi:hypothetical protein Nepgr_015439 [Nepenthes gracilis]|uniref:Bifunctional lysine-specific demethylase and histidyl-hydroxylase n=1 Tax=Nepenthes gracilis TaxID=150966 RepID=A0AAD3SLN2_NEPGR|nr:hypothetical protein Nepgr_015439 [Nepenthes gracilis]
MEEREMGSRRADKRRRKSKTSHIAHRRPSNPETLFSLTLAALTNPQNPSSESLIKTSLNVLLRLFLKESPNLFSPTQEDTVNSVLALLPLLFKSRCAEILWASARIVGAASLISVEMNGKIASDAEIVKALARKVVSSERRVAMAACNSILDVSTTSFGRQRLLELSALNYLMLGFLQVLKSSGSSSSLCTVDNRGAACLGVELREDELLLLLLNALVTLINSCSIEQQDKIPRKLIVTSLVHLKQLWPEVREQMLAGNIMTVCQGKHKCLSNLTANNLAESIFRLSMNALHTDRAIESEVVVRHIFGSGKSSFVDFISNHWESSPFLIRGMTKDLDKQGGIFSSFVKFNCAGKVPLFISSMLQGMVSCIPIASDETDILSFLEEIRGALGCPIIYQQDIRVLTIEPDLKTERHYFQGSLTDHSIKVPISFFVSDILKCEEAYKQGYTIALRGMEFRFKSIAAIADQVASLFGQPSVGANLYLTPPNSQGLACHCDDHCVFICQLLGTKQWTIYLEPVFQLPRLYQHLECPWGSMMQKRQIILNEGDVMYIPRGFPHEASTIVGTDGTAEFSLHVTLSVEIEPPFDWEGFAHVALLQWSQNLKVSLDLATGISSTFSVRFLHVAIRLIRNAEPVFRKACLVAADSLTSDPEDWLEHNQRAIFNSLINKIYELSSFTDALETIQIAIQRCEDPFCWMGWLSVLIDKEMSVHYWKFPSEGIDKLLPLIDQHRDSAEAAFVHVKSKFCREALFDDVKECYKKLHDMYKKTRNQYMNGMLSLHY